RRVDDGRHEIFARASRVAHGRERRRVLALVPLRLELGDPGALDALDLRVDAERGNARSRLVLHVLVPGHHAPAALPDLTLEPVAGGRYRGLRVPFADGVPHAAHGVDPFDVRERFFLELVREPLDVVAAAERIDGVGNPRLAQDDLLRAKGDGDRLFGGKR